MVRHLLAFWIEGLTTTRHAFYFPAVAFMGLLQHILSYPSHGEVSRDLALMYEVIKLMRRPSAAGDARAGALLSLLSELYRLAEKAAAKFGGGKETAPKESETTTSSQLSSTHTEGVAISPTSVVDSNPSSELRYEVSLTSPKYEFRKTSTDFAEGLSYKS